MLNEPWWERITEEEWRAMSPRERLLTKIAIPGPISLFSKNDPQAQTPCVPFSAAGDSITLTETITLS